MYLGESFHHALWCRQLRRLQSYVKASKPAPAQQHKQAHMYHLWQAIRRAKGFAKGFAYAWFHRGHVTVGSPARLPREPPDHDVAESVFLNFRHEFEALEKALTQARCLEARQNRRHDANAVFRDVAKPRALPVQTIAKSKLATVTNVDFSTNTVQYDPPHLATTELVYGPQGLLSIASHTEGEMVLRTDVPLSVGDELTQQALIGSKADVAENFVAMWKPMWDRHANCTPSDWEAFMHDIADQVPSPDSEMPMPPITPDQWIAAVRSKKSRSATGPDGVARKDLLALPANATACLVDHINRIDRGELAWHPSSMTGLIALVEKRPGACTPNEFRPICVLSFLYRTWSSIRAKQCLQWLHQLAPPHQYGNRPNMSARHVWWKLAMQVEAATYSKQEMAGLITDVVKCFNTLPRPIIAFCGRHLGLPKQLIHTWMQAITCISRRFVIEGSVSQPLASTTGFPEGDALSVVSMAILNIAMDAMVSRQTLSTKIISYVDNWEAVTTEVDEIPTISAAFQAFADKADIKLDTKKTETWCLQANGRKWLQGHGFTVVMNTRDLGGQMVYCRKPCLATIKARIAQHSELWNWIQRSKASTSLKLRLLHTVAWPRCLHACSNHSIGSQHMQQLRIAAMQALKWQKKGANSLLQMGLERDPRSDPGYYCLATAVADFRDLHEPETAFPLLNALAIDAITRAVQGPCSALLERLRMIHWSWQGNGYILDHEQLEWHLVDAPIQWVSQRLRQGWAKHIGESVCSRATFGGLQCVDIHLMYEGIQRLSAPAQGFLRVLQNGTYYTRELLFQTGKVPDEKCPFCDAKDGINHRHWHCPHFANIRNTLDQEACSWLREEPSCFVLRGWVVEHPSQIAFRRSLFDIQDETAKIELPDPLPDGTLNFFTDGSCTDPVTPCLRLGTWGCCLAMLPDDTFCTVGQGGISGGYHTTLRAEICAVICAFEAGLRANRPFTVWVDNASVYNKLLSFQTAGVTYARPRATNHDLWNRLAALAHVAISRRLFAYPVKVRSHEDRAQYPELVERWAIDGNAKADAAAEGAVDLLPSHIAPLHRQAQARVARARRMRDVMRTLITRSGFLATSTTTDQNRQTEETWQSQIARPRSFEVTDLSLTPLPTTCDLPDNHSLGQHAQVIFDWLCTVSRGSNVTPMWLSSHHMLIHFQGTTRLMEFRFNQRNNKWDALDAGEDSAMAFHKVANAFQAAIKCLAVGLGLPYHPQQRLPEGSVYRCWINCLLVPMDVAMFQRIEALMLSRGRAGISNVTKAMATWGDFRGDLCLWRPGLSYVAEYRHVSTSAGGKRENGFKPPSSIYMFENMRSKQNLTRRDQKPT